MEWYWWICIGLDIVRRLLIFPFLFFRQDGGLLTDFYQFGYHWAVTHFPHFIFSVIACESLLKNIFCGCQLLLLRTWRKEATIQRKTAPKRNPIPKVIQWFLQNIEGYWTQYPFLPVRQSNKNQIRLPLQTPMTYMFRCYYLSTYWYIYQITGARNSPYGDICVAWQKALVTTD